MNAECRLLPAAAVAVEFHRCWSGQVKGWHGDSIILDSVSSVVSLAWSRSMRRRMTLNLLIFIVICFQIPTGVKAHASSIASDPIVSTPSREIDDNNNNIGLIAPHAQPLPQTTPKKSTTSKRSRLLNAFSKYNQREERVLTYYGMMLAGAVARSASATAVHPLNVWKTMLQTKGGTPPLPITWEAYSRGAGSQFLMSIPHGALNYAVTETIKIELAKIAIELELNSKVSRRILDPVLDFLSSALSTFVCSIVSTPQMVLTDRIMAGVYPNFLEGVQTIARSKEGISGFYVGWFPALVQKIPSYALTWIFFQQIKTAFFFAMQRTGNTLENTILGALAAAGACCVMIPVDTIKTRLVMDGLGEDARAYSGMIDCCRKMISDEGWRSLYRALTPRLLAVTPMIGIQFGVYETIKRLFLQQSPLKGKGADENVNSEGSNDSNSNDGASDAKEDIENDKDALMEPLSDFDVLNPTITTMDPNLSVAGIPPSDSAEEPQ